MQFVGRSDFATIGSDRAKLARCKIDLPTSWTVVFWFRLFTERSAIEKQLDLITITVNLDIFLVYGQVLRRPIREENLRTSLVDRVVTGIGGRQRSAGHAPRNVNHRFVAPPA